MFTRKFFTQTLDCTVRFCAAYSKNKFPYGNLLKTCDRCRSFCVSCHTFSFKSELFHVPVSAQMWVNLGRILVHKCRECLFFPFGTIIVPSLGLFRYIIVPFLGICFLFHFRYRKCTKINPKVVHSLPRKSSTQTWYNPWLILRPKWYISCLKNGRPFRLPVDFLFYSEIIYLFRERFLILAIAYMI